MGFQITILITVLHRDWPVLPNRMARYFLIAALAS
jgi:hypothetical protein